MSRRINAVHARACVILDAPEVRLVEGRKNHLARCSHNNKETVRETRTRRERGREKRQQRGIPLLGEHFELQASSLQ
jgi:hypothetical protein